MTRPKLWVSNFDRVDNWEAETKMSRGRQFLGIKKFHLLLLEMRRPKQIFFGVSWWSVNGVGHGIHCTLWTVKETCGDAEEIVLVFVLDIFWQGKNSHSLLPTSKVEENDKLFVMNGVLV